MIRHLKLLVIQTIREPSNYNQQMLRWIHILTMVLSIITKILNSKLLIIWEYQNTKIFFAKGYIPNSSKEVFLIKIVKNTLSFAYVISNLNGEKTVGEFYEKELQKTSKKEFRIEKVIKRKDDRLYVKWKGCDNSCNK